MGSCCPHLTFEERRAIHRKLIRHPEIKAAAEDALKSGWPPEQIAGRMRLERHPIGVSHETIYRFAYKAAPSSCTATCPSLADAAVRVAGDGIATGPSSIPGACAPALPR